MGREFQKLADWKDFERLCTDLLEAEGFHIESEPFIDRTGKDMLCEEEHRSHTGQVVRLRWRIQCKHLAGSGTNLGREEVEKALVSYQALGKQNYGLLIIVDTDYTEAAKDVVDEFTRENAGARVAIWNQRQILSRLSRHPDLIARYGIGVTQQPVQRAFVELSTLGPVKTLLISDQSAFAHDVASALRLAGFSVTFLPVWNYLSPSRVKLLDSFIASNQFKLVVVFLGDSFNFPIPADILLIIQHAHIRGGSLLLFPFVAWTLRKGCYEDSLLPLVPVTLEEPLQSFKAQNRRGGGYRHGDFGWLLDFDSFAENEYREYDLAGSRSPLTTGLDARFGLTHSFEYLNAVSGAEVAVRDTTGNPLIVVNEGQGKVCYFNSCCHSCVSVTAIPSPLEVSVECQQLLANIIRWLIK